MTVRGTRANRYVVSVSVITILVICGTGFCEEKEQAGIGKYRIISERNIFSRQRYGDGRDASGNIEMQKKVLSLYILKGISQRGEKKIAFIENGVSGEYTRAGTGDSISGCVIKNIDPNCITIEKDGKESSVKLGAEIARTETEVAVERSLPSESEGGNGNKTNGSPPAAVSPVVPEKSGGGEAEILKKMMERRRSQVGN